MAPSLRFLFRDALLITATASAAMAKVILSDSTTQSSKVIATEDAAKIEELANFVGITTVGLTTVTIFGPSSFATLVFTIESESWATPFETAASPLPTAATSNLSLSEVFSTANFSASAAPTAISNLTATPTANNITFTLPAPTDDPTKPQVTTQVSDEPTAVPADDKKSGARELASPLKHHLFSAIAVGLSIALVM